MTDTPKPKSLEGEGEALQGVHVVKDSPVNPSGTPDPMGDEDKDSPGDVGAKAPGNMTDLYEDTAPLGGTLQEVVGTRQPTGTHDQVTRRTIAYSVLGAVIVIDLAVFGSFLLGNIDSAGLTAAIAGLAGPQALAAAVVGFYYGSVSDTE